MKKIKKKKKRGFTLIELLAVIVILGILMIIVVPSVTKYIVETRKKTFVSTISNYMSAAMFDVNSMKYEFTDINTIYAVPIDCIKLEKGGESPFGEWKPASNNSWAYVLIQFNGDVTPYVYGFTFKDSAGYSLYPTTHGNIKQDGEQIKIDFNIPKPINGVALNLIEKEYWNGFNVNDSTKIKILDHNTCDFVFPCSSNGTKIGDKITCGTEEFYIISQNSNTITMLAQYSLDLQANVQKQIPGSKGQSSFTTTNCIPSGITSYPAYIYGPNCTIYNHVEKYKNFLVESGVTSATARLISHIDLEKLGCTIKDGSGTCPNTYPWIFSPYGIYWVGSATGKLYPYYGVSVSGIGSWNPSYPGFVRPVITISIDDVKIER